MNIGSEPFLIAPNAIVTISRDMPDDPSDPDNTRTSRRPIARDVPVYIGASTGGGPRPRFGNWQNADFSQGRWYWARFDDASLDLRDNDYLAGYTPPDSIPTTEPTLFRLYVRKYLDPIPHLGCYLEQINL